MAKPTTVKNAQNPANARPPEIGSGSISAGELNPSSANQRHTAANTSAKTAPTLAEICRPIMRHRSRSRLAGDFGFHQLGEERERFLPAEIARLRWNDLGHAFLHDADFGADGHFRERDRHRHDAGQVRVVEAIRVADALARHELEVLATEGMALAGGEVPERHLVRAAD